MKGRTFFLPKKSGTYADSLQAVGLCHLLHVLTDKPCHLSDAGPHYEVTCRDEIDLSVVEVDRLRHNPGDQFVKTSKDSGDLPRGAGQVVDYDAGRERLLAYRKLRDSMRGAARTPEDEERLRLAAPAPDWYLIQNLNVMAARKAMNNLHSAIRGCDPGIWSRSVREKLAALATQQDPAEVRTEFNPSVTAVQALNPTAGKGINRPKPVGPTLSNLRGDWFEEWLRFVGIFRAANAFSIGKDGKDMKFIALAPRDIDGEILNEIHDDFLRLRMGWSSIQLDVQHALGTAEKLIERSGWLEGEKRAVFRRRWRPRDIVAGIHTAYFMSLGNARALSNNSFIGLPGWFPIESRQDASDWLEVLAENRKVLRTLDEDRSEEAEILAQYRNFLSANDLNAFLTFTARYGEHVMRSAGVNRPTVRLTTTNTRRLVLGMEKRYLPILQSEGFQRIAEAIRRATVTEQIYKSKGLDVFTIHYGLFQELRRKARFKDQFTAALGDFIASYNAENARRIEMLGGKKGRRRRQVTTTNLEEVIGLVDEFGSEPIAMLLIAYGSARDPQEPQEAAEAVDVPEGEDEPEAAVQ